MTNATLMLLVSCEIDLADVDADEAARAIAPWSDAIVAGLRARGLRVSGVSHVIVPTPADTVSQTLGAFADELERRRRG